MEWLSYEDAKARLKWDSNRNALWELNWKLLNNKNRFIIFLIKKIVVIGSGKKYVRKNSI